MHAPHGWAGAGGIPLPPFRPSQMSTTEADQHIQSLYAYSRQCKDEIAKMNERLGGVESKVKSVLDIAALVQGHNSQLSCLEDKLELASSKVVELEGQIERLYVDQKRRNCKITGLEERTENGDELLIYTVDTIRQYYRGWDLQQSDIEKIYRVGRRGRYPRPIIICFVRQHDAERLLHDKNGRDEMAYDKIWVGPDLTRDQREKMRELKDKGLKGVLRGGKVVPVGPAGSGYSSGFARGWSSTRGGSAWHRESKPREAGGYDSNPRSYSGHSYRRRDAQPRNRHLVSLPRHDSDIDSDDEWHRRGWTVKDSIRHGDCESDHGHTSSGQGAWWNTPDWPVNDERDDDFPPLQEGADDGQSERRTELVPPSYPAERGMSTAAHATSVETVTAATRSATRSAASGEESGEAPSVSTESCVVRPVVRDADIAVTEATEASAHHDEQHQGGGETESAELPEREEQAGGESPSGVTDSGPLSRDEEGAGRDSAGGQVVTEIVEVGAVGAEGDNSSAKSRLSNRKSDKSDETRSKEKVTATQQRDSVSMGVKRGKGKEKKGESDLIDEKGKRDTESNRAKTRSSSITSNGSQTNLDSWRGNKKRLSLSEKACDQSGRGRGRGRPLKEK